MKTIKVSIEEWTKWLSVNRFLGVAFAFVGSAILPLIGLQSVDAQSPLYNNIPPVKQDLPMKPPSSDIDLTNVQPATSVGDANNKFSARAAAAIYQAASLDLSRLAVNSPDYGNAILAKWAYKDYFNGPNGDSYRRDATTSLMQQQAGKTGTDGDYDFLLNLYIPLVYKYYNDLTYEVREHIINDLLNVRGPLSKHESEHIFYPAVGTYIPETENHLFLIETARYLTNQLLYQRTHNSQFDNRRNGDDNDPPATVVWLLGALDQILQHDFLEYNARPYQDNIMMALLNLASYAYDDDVRLAARMALDYISAKVAVSSNDLRRAPPFRRRNEDEHWGPSIQGGFFLRSPLLKAKSNYPDRPGEFAPDVQGTWYAILAGNTDLLGSDSYRFAPANKKGNFSLAMVFAGVHDYRVPEPILDLFVNRINRRFYQRFHHVHSIPDVLYREYVDELYAGSPSYLITAGGHPTHYCYMPVIGGFNVDTGKTADLGSAMPTTFMPTGSDLTLESMIQFGAYTDLITDNDPVKHHMGVAPDFACGALTYVPAVFANPPEKIRSQPHWTFIDRGNDSTHPGYFLAIYHQVDDPIGGYGFLEAFDTWLHPGVTFDQFIAGVLARNGSTVFLLTGDNTYVTTAGQQIRFTIAPRSEILSINGVSPPTDKFLYGDVLNSNSGSGIITISNPLYNPITLSMPPTPDLAHPFHVCRTSETGKVECAGSDLYREVWVDFNSPANVPEHGDFYHPFKTLTAARDKVAVGGTIKIVPGLKNETIVISKPMIIKSFPGSATIGPR